MSGKKEGELETRCAAISLPSRVCFFKEAQPDKLCNERSKYQCQLWKSYLKPVVTNPESERGVFVGKYDEYFFAGEFLE